MTPTERRLEIVRENIRHYEKQLSRYRLEEAQLVTDIASERERVERMEMLAGKRN